jgi:hypothetical protein
MYAPRRLPQLRHGSDDAVPRAAAAAAVAGATARNCGMDPMAFKDR